MKPILIICLLAIACNLGNTQKEARKDSADAMKESMDYIDQSTVKFVTAVANGNLDEIALGKIAQKNADYNRLITFADKMITAHTLALDKLQKASYSTGVTVPTGSSDNGKLSSFSKKQGLEFDKDYIKEMVSAHQKMADILDAGRKDLKDSALRQYAEQMLPEVNAHLFEARNILEDIRKQKRNRPEQGKKNSH